MNYFVPFLNKMRISLGICLAMVMLLLLPLGVVSAQNELEEWDVTEARSLS